MSNEFRVYEKILMPENNDRKRNVVYCSVKAKWVMFKFNFLKTTQIGET